MSEAKEALVTTEPEPSSEPLPSYEDSFAPPPPVEAGAVGFHGPLPEHPRIPPTRLTSHGRFIHAEDRQAAPLYELSHEIAFLKDSDRSVRFERLDRAVVQRLDTPQVTTRNKHLYDLKHPTAGTWPTFEYHAEPVSRQAKCTMGLKCERTSTLSSQRRIDIVKAVTGANRQLVEKERLFSAQPPPHHHGSGRTRAGGAAEVICEWRDPDDMMVAREVEENGAPHFVISVEMDEQTRDALVAAWITKVWRELSLQEDKPSLLGHAKVLSKSHGLYINGI